MAMPISVLKAKALGFIQAIEKLTSEERYRTPTGKFGEDYNRLRKYVAEAIGDVSLLLPPEATIDTGQVGESFTDIGYGEILTFAQQIYQLLDAVESNAKR